MASTTAEKIPLRTRPIRLGTHLLPNAVATGGVFLYLMLLLSFQANAQRLPSPDALTMEDGLGFRDVRTIAQDSRGLIWFGTSQGIERYDGLHFVKFSSGQQGSFSFPGQDVSNENMLMVSDTSLWVVADGVLFSLNLQTQKTTDLTEAAGLSGKVYTLRQARDSTIWVVTDDDREQLLLRYLGNNHFEQVATAQHLRMPFNDVACDTSGNVWWSTNAEGLRLFSPVGELLHAVKPDSIIWYDTKIYYTNIDTDSKNRLFVFPKSTNEIWQYHPETRQCDVLADSLPSRVYLGLEDARGNLWFNTFEGLYRWNQAGEWTDFTAALNSSLQFSNIHHLYEDRTHLLWVATDNGLLRFPIGRDLFQNYLTVPGAKWGNAMRGIFADDEGSVYAFCENGQWGLHRLESPTHKGRQFFPFHDSLSHEPVMEHVNSFVFDKKENAAWTLNDNLLKISMKGHQGNIVENFAGVSSKVSRSPFCLLQDGTIVLGAMLENLTVYDPQSRHRGSFFPDGTSGIPSTSLSVMLEAPNGLVWVGTASEGLFCFDRNGETLAHFSTKTQPALSNDHILALHFDKTGKLWVGTFGGGLCRIELSKEVPPFEKVSPLAVRIFTKKEGLSDDNVVSILEDGEGNIWAATYNGLSCYRAAEGVFHNFYEEDGLSNNEFNYSSFFKDNKGRLWFGGMNGINMIDPKDILQADKNPALCLTGFTKYNSKTDSTILQVIGNETIERFDISPHVSWFQFGWALPNYFKPDKNHYYAQLAGLDGDWSYLGSSPFVRYNKLPPGDYTLRVKASDSKGNWSMDELAVPITVHPFFFETWWFYLLVLAAVAGIVYGISRYHYQRKLEMEKMRTQIASDLHDEVGSMLSGLAMQAEILELQGHSSHQSSLVYLKEVSRQAVGKMRDMVWSIDSRRDQVKDLLDRMREHAEETFPPLDITCQFSTTGVQLTHKLPVDVRQQLFLIFREAVTNICKHANADRVNVFFGNRDGHFEMSIHDNGSSLPSVKNATGLGLANMRMRAEAVGAEFSIKDSDGFMVKIRMRNAL